MKTHCVRCGRRLTDDCPKKTSQSPCQDCKTAEGEPQCRRRSPKRNICLHCNRAYMNAIYSKPIRRQRANREEMKSLAVGPLVLDDVAGDVVVHWEPRQKGEEAVYMAQWDVDRLREWLGAAAARRPARKPKHAKLIPRRPVP